MERRVNNARRLLIEDRILLETKTRDTWFFEVKSLNDKDVYQVAVSDRGCNCTCEYGSIWGFGDKKLPCHHIIACIGATMLKVRRKENV